MQDPATLVAIAVLLFALSVFAVALRSQRRRPAAPSVPQVEHLEWTGATRRKRDAKRFNEHVKLLATFLNNFAIALLVTGALAPAINGGVTFTWARALLALLAASMLHGFAQAVLRFWRSEE